MPTPWEFIFLIQERPLSPRSPAVSFEIAAATMVSVLKSGGRGVGWGLGGITKAVICKAVPGLSPCDLVKMTQINILYLNQTKINGSLSVRLSPTVTRQAFVGQNQH